MTKMAEALLKANLIDRERYEKREQEMLEAELKRIAEAEAKRRREMEERRREMKERRRIRELSAEVALSTTGHDVRRANERIKSNPHITKRK